MRVDVYVDGLNLFYGGRAMLPSSDSWKWLNLRSLSEMAIAQGSQWSEIDRLRVNYFTAQVKGAPDSLARQQVYCLALRAAKSVDYIYFGEFQVLAKESLAAVGEGRRFQLVSALVDPLPEAQWVRVDSEELVRVRHKKSEEKGSDVNIATWLLMDAQIR